MKKFQLRKNKIFPMKAPGFEPESFGLEPNRIAKLPHAPKWALNAQNRVFILFNVFNDLTDSYILFFFTLLIVCKRRKHTK